MSSILSLATSLSLVATALAAQSAETLHAAASSTAVPLQQSQAEWQPEPGVQLYVDTSENMGYLVHTDGRYLKFDVLTGQRRWVYFIGRSYNAKTPEWNWVIHDVEHKHPSVTFGPTGRFLRMYKDGDTRTAYGIHGHRYAEKMLAEKDEHPLGGYRSYGCILVNEEMLDLIETVLEVNGGTLNVRTISSLQISELFAVDR